MARRPDGARRRAHVGAAAPVRAAWRASAPSTLQARRGRHRHRADRQPEDRRRGDRAAGGAVLRRLRCDASPTKRRPDGLRGRSGRRRHPAAGLRRGGARRRAVGRGRELHMGLDLRHLPRVRSARAAGAAGDPARLRAATHALRLPLHGGFEPMAAVTRDIPFIARRSSRDPADTRRALGSARRPPGRARRRSAPRRRSARSTACAQGDRFALIDPRRDPPAGLSLPGSGRRRRRRRQQARVRDRLGMRRQRDGAALHLARPLRRIRCVRRGNAARLAVPLHFAGRFARRPLGGGHRRAAGTAGAAATRRASTARTSPRTRS